ncbi:MAG: A24 family peptidase [Nocardioides sp.]|nr:A24 family peptidase [Nocardioides sp.]
MNDTALAIAIAAVLTGLGGLLVPALISRVPEPAPKAPATSEEPVEDAEPVAPENPKARYADIGARPGLGRQSALVSALCGGLLGAATGLDWPLGWLVLLTPFAVALSVIDWHTRLLPRIVVLPATALAIALVTAVGLATGERDALVRALLGMVAVRSFFWILWFIRSAGMGFGDVRLAAIVGLVLGWEGWGALAIGVWVGFVCFALPGLVLAIVRRDRSLMKKPFPYGPFMVVGALFGLVWGTALAERIWG